MKLNHTDKDLLSNKARGQPLDQNTLNSKEFNFSQVTFFLIDFGKSVVKAPKASVSTEQLCLTCTTVNKCKASAPRLCLTTCHLTKKFLSRGNSTCAGEVFKVANRNCFKK